MFIKLAREDFQQACAYVWQQARPVDQALLRYTFEDGAAAAVLEALAAYQNPDGGFGQALEPDFWLPGSSGIATTVAFQYLHAVRTPADHPFVRQGIRYFLDTYKNQTWVDTPPEVINYPRAPWWPFTMEPLIGSNGEQIWYQPNPSAEVVGYLHQYPQEVPPEFLQQVTAQAIKNFDLLEDPISPHTLLCYSRMADNLPEKEKARFAPKLRQRAMLSIPTDPAVWASGYVLLPHTFAPTPSSLLADLLGDSIQHSLAFGIQRQDPAGCWTPTWQWGQYPGVWQQAKLEWQGYLTVQMLGMLKRYGLIET